WRSAKRESEAWRTFIAIPPAKAWHKLKIKAGTEDIFPTHLAELEFHASASISIGGVQLENWRIETAALTLPPGAVVPALGSIGEAVIVEVAANVARRVLGKRIVLEQRQNGGRALQQPDQKTAEPWIAGVIA